MATIIKKISLDVSAPNRIPGIPAKQYDTDSRFLNITLTNEGETLPVSNSATVSINARRADGKAAAFEGTVEEDGTVTVPLTPWMLALPDTVCCDVSVREADGAVLSTMNFAVCVEHSNYSDYDPVPDTPGIYHADWEETDGGKAEYIKNKPDLRMGAAQGSLEEGPGTIAHGDYQHVLGKYNEPDENSEYAVVVGGGESDRNRRTICTLDWSGNPVFAGDTFRLGAVSLTVNEIQDLQGLLEMQEAEGESF